MKDLISRLREQERGPGKPSRRKFLHLLAGSATVAMASRIVWGLGSAKAAQAVRAATGLLATWQSTAWLGAEAGLFKTHNIDMILPAIAVGGPQAAAGLIRGDWEFAHTGAIPVAEEVLIGRDIVILSTPTSEFANSFVMTRKEITDLSQLGGKKVGVLSETGQTSVAAQQAPKVTPSRTSLNLRYGSRIRGPASPSVSATHGRITPSQTRLCVSGLPRSSAVWLVSRRAA